MPSLADLDASVSPLTDPLSYPGIAVDADYLWVDSWTYEIIPARALRAPADGGLGQWQVTVDGGPLAPRPSRTPHPAVVGVDVALALMGAAPMTARRPVLSFGSNSAPAQLRAKFASLDPASRVIPVLRAVISGLGLGHSAHVSNPGYLPYVLVDNGSASRLAVFMLWLDLHQVEVMNGTEPNYDLVGVPVDRYPLTLPGGEIVAGYAAYKGKWGALRLPGASMPLAAGSQHQLLAELSGVPWFRLLVGDGDPRSHLGRLRDDRVLRERVRVELAGSGMVIDDGWTGVDQ